MTPAELGAGREPAPERPGATVVAPRDRGARCLPRGASESPAAGLRGKRVPGCSFRRRRACTPPSCRARQVVPRCSFILTLWEPSASAGASWSPGERGWDRDLRLQQNNNKNLGALRSALVRCPPPGSLAGGAGPGGPRRECPRLGTDSAPPALRARRPDPLKAPVGYFHFASKGQKNNPRCWESAPGQFPMPLMVLLAGLSSESHVLNSIAFL